ncbi:NAD-dependent epimerase/dehydratase family protein [Lactobacillus sp. HBUAS51381]|uniref:NAD-dependent epimerase/dehydratase family protein n=1 Tax=Lactobacillus sp. HBUAS51381 TaxID=2722743 RepID=UPI0014566D46|nr:NAD-dependent epimerase/dehydratase family protein [Lactobacillus sp. HBUAS51381]NLR09055.1 NAD-dependent epimerase/dehydratase family protein [Lactobacillus sp. HBUAS51381]
MEKILVTGGAGFIGSNLVDKLVQKDCEVYVVDDLSMGKRSNLPRSEHVHFFQRSIIDFDFMEKLLVREQFEYIFLMAAVASVADTVVHPYSTHRVNQDADVFLLEVIRKNNLKPKKVLFTSSAAVYGDDPQLPKGEMSRINPLSPYAIDKYATERFVINYGKLYGINTVATRFFNVYGPKQNPKSPYSGVLSIIADCLSSGSPFNVFGDGEQTRDFVYIDDVVAALMLLIRSENTNGYVYNVATGISTDLNEVISIFEKVSEKKLTVVHKDPRKGDIKYSVADVTRLSNLGYEAMVPITVGLRRYWNFL